jgi:hypothetical protein
MRECPDMPVAEALKGVDSMVPTSIPKNLGTGLEGARGLMEWLRSLAREFDLTFSSLPSVEAQLCSVDDGFESEHLFRVSVGVHKRRLHFVFCDGGRVQCGSKLPSEGGLSQSCRAVYPNWDDGIRAALRHLRDKLRETRPSDPSCAVVIEGLLK